MKELTKNLIKSVDKMSTAINKCQEICERQSVSLAECQKDIRELIKANMELTRALEESRKDYRETIQCYRDELHSAKAMYQRVSELYVLETSGKKKAAPVSKAEVSINK